MNKAAFFGGLVILKWLCATQAFAAPMTLKEISMLLRNGEQQSYIQEQANLRNLSAPLTAQDDAALTALGATPALINALHATALATAPAPAPVPPVPASTPSATIPSTPALRTLLSERQKFPTKLKKSVKANLPVPTPPDARFQLVSYRSPVGELPALMTTVPQDGARHPAIIWIIGGWSNSISPAPWEPAKPENDQSAAAFAKAGIITLYPSLRGGNQNPGSMENFYGEVDDVIAAADFLSRQPGVDPSRIYLGGHSTGGTLVLLVAECSDRFRAVFAFGAVASAGRYSKAGLNFDLTDPKEMELRSPGNWLHCIHNPTFVLEGASGGNLDDLNYMHSRTNNPMIHFFPIGGADHFSILGPLTRLVASKIIADTGPTSNITFATGKVTIP